MSTNEKMSINFNFYRKTNLKADYFIQLLKNSFLEPNHIYDIIRIVQLTPYWYNVIILNILHKLLFSLT
jgi:hypothetical protein